MICVGAALTGHENYRSTHHTRPLVENDCHLALDHAKRLWRWGGLTQAYRAYQASLCEPDDVYALLDAVCRCDHRTLASAMSP